MAKPIAAILILLASFILSRTLPDIYKKRVNFLSGFLEFITFAIGEIDFYKREMEIVIENFTKDRRGEFTDFLKDRYLFKKEVEIDSDRRIVEEFISRLTELDCSAQKNYSEMYIEKVKKLLVTAEETYKSKGNLMRKLVPLAGAALFVIII